MSGNILSLYLHLNMYAIESIFSSFRLNTTAIRFFDQYISIHLYAKPTRSSQQLRFKLKDEGRKEKHLVLSRFTFVDDPELPSTFVYPKSDLGSEAVLYQPRERAFAIYTASPGRKLTVILDTIDIEDCCDWLQLTWLSPSNPPKLQYRR